ncbi:MAG: transposase of ISPca5, Tnp [candidate division NC10 bacterium]|jgi:hypothetical protein|nr:transposase of ISPca5, Tnp [candidate division NC10 bacterium]
MPRQARLDAAGALHHVICRGIERQAIVRDDVERVETGKMDASVILTFVVVGAATLCVLVWSGY